MQLQKLLNQNFKRLTPQALIIIQRLNHYTAQTVDYAPEILNLGVVLLGYYASDYRTRKLSQLSDCLSVAHYLRSPRALKYGRDFTNNSQFKRLPAKIRKHLADEIHDCTMAFARDFGIKKALVTFNNLAEFLKTHTEPYVYLYQSHKWWLLRIDSHNLTSSVNLRAKLSQILNKKA